MNKEILYYDEASKHLSITPLEETGEISFGVGDNDYMLSTLLDKYSVKDLITTLTDFYIKVKDK